MPERNEVIRHDQQRIVQKAYINGINRLNNNNKPSKAKGLQEKILKPNKTTIAKNQDIKTAKTLYDEDINLSDLDVNKSMSKSIEQIFFNGHLKIDACNNDLVNDRLVEKDTLDLSITQTSSDTSILHLDNDSLSSRNKESLSETSTSNLSYLSILPSSKKTYSNGTSNDIKPITDMEFLNLQPPLQGISLEGFESRRKMIEEQNRHRTEMLYKAIEYQ